MRLICFGDSWTAGHGVETDKKFKEIPFPDAFIQKLREQNSWPRWLANKFDCEFVNLGVCGYGNHYIYRDLSNAINNNFIDENDIVIVMFSYPYRYQQHNIFNVVELFWLFEKLLKNYKHFYFNAFFPYFKEEIDFDFDTLPKCFINPKLSVSDKLKDYELENNADVWEYGSRSVWNDHKNFYEGDYHPNIMGYKIIADFIYDKLKNEL